VRQRLNANRLEVWTLNSLQQEPPESIFQTFLSAEKFTIVSE
jgi:hypothetical protein